MGVAARRLAIGVANGATAASSSPLPRRGDDGGSSPGSWRSAWRTGRASYAPGSRGGRKWGLNRRHWPHRNACFDGILREASWWDPAPDSEPKHPAAGSRLTAAREHTRRRTCRQSDHLGRCGRIDTWSLSEGCLSRRSQEVSRAGCGPRASHCRTSGLCSCVPPRTRARHVFARSSFGSPWLRPERSIPFLEKHCYGACIASCSDW